MMMENRIIIVVVAKDGQSMELNQRFREINSLSVSGATRDDRGTPTTSSTNPKVCEINYDCNNPLKSHSTAHSLLCDNFTPLLLSVVVIWLCCPQNMRRRRKVVTISLRQQQVRWMRYYRALKSFFHGRARSGQAGMECCVYVRVIINIKSVMVDDAAVGFLLGHRRRGEQVNKVTPLREGGEHTPMDLIYIL